MGSAALHFPVHPQKTRHLHIIASCMLHCQKYRGESVNASCRRVKKEFLPCPYTLLHIPEIAFVLIRDNSATRNSYKRGFPLSPVLGSAACNQRGSVNVPLGTCFLQNFPTYPQNIPQTNIFFAFSSSAFIYAWRMKGARHIENLPVCCNVHAYPMVLSPEAMYLQPLYFSFLLVLLLPRK